MAPSSSSLLVVLLAVCGAALLLAPSPAAAFKGEPKRVAREPSPFRFTFELHRRICFFDLLTPGAVKNVWWTVDMRKEHGNVDIEIKGVDAQVVFHERDIAGKFYDGHFTYQVPLSYRYDPDSSDVNWKICINPDGLTRNVPFTIDMAGAKDALVDPSLSGAARRVLKLQSEAHTLNQGMLEVIDQDGRMNDVYDSTHAYIDSVSYVSFVVVIAVQAAQIVYLRRHLKQKLKI